MCSLPCHTISVQSYFLFQLLFVLHLLFSLHVYERPMSVSIYYKCQYFRLLRLLGIHYYTVSLLSPLDRFVTVLSLGEFLCVCWFYPHDYYLFPLLFIIISEYIPLATAISHTFLFHTFYNFLPSFFSRVFINMTNFQPC